MNKTTCGIDVSKDRLDVAVHPSSERFAVLRTGAGLEDLVARLKAVKPNLIVLEATFGIERSCRDRALPTRWETQPSDSPQKAGKNKFPTFQ